MRSELVVVLVAGISAVAVGRAEHMLQPEVPYRVELRDTGMPLAEALRCESFPSCEQA